MQSNELILAEVKVMKQLDSHKNICNLLAYCTVGRLWKKCVVTVPEVSLIVGYPVYVIMEYACHGNLKEYLDDCRQTILQSGQSPFISTTGKYL